MAEEIVASGGLLPDDIMLKVVSSKLDLLHNKVRLLCDLATRHSSLTGHHSTGCLTAFHAQLDRGNCLTTT